MWLYLYLFLEEIHVHYSLSEVNNYDTHIVAPFTLGTIDIGWQQCVEKTFSNLTQLHFTLHLDIDIVNNLLTSFSLPNAIASHNGKVSLASDLVHLDIRQRRDSLLVQL